MACVGGLRAGPTGPGSRVRNKHARYARMTAERLGYQWRALDGGDGYIFEISDGDRRAVLAGGSATPYALNSAASYCLARDKGFANDALALAGVAHIPSRLFFANSRHAAQRAPGREPEDARAFARGAVYPMFCKPTSGARGDFAERIGDARAFDAYLARVGLRYDAILAQPFLRGAEHRVFILNGAALFSYAKTAPALIGDGASDLRALYKAHVARFVETSIAPTPFENLAFKCEGETLDAAFVPARGECIAIEGRANRSAGGGARDFSDSPPTPLAEFALAAAAALKLNLAGVDIFDLSPSRDLSNLVIIEINANPAIETLEEMQRFDLIEIIWAANFEAALK